MKKTKFRRLAAMAASLLCCLIFTVPAYAQSSEPQPETAPSPAETEAEPETQNPFTPDGTGTVVDNATDEDGKEFYTITTADESVFYLVIDKQKTSENVYFLNTVNMVCYGLCGIRHTYIFKHLPPQRGKEKNR